MLIFLHNKNAVVVRVELPSSMPPSYRGMTVRYLYYGRSAVVDHWLENALSNTVCTKEFAKLVGFLWKLCIPCLPLQHLALFISILYYITLL